ncbi:hypothetical protein DPV78_011728, partial [Talaromyces pinophilus]
PKKPRSKEETHLFDSILTHSQIPAFRHYTSPVATVDGVRYPSPSSAQGARGAQRAGNGRQRIRWILHGYRPISGSFRASLSSWWYFHNETVNIYSHLIPAVVFLLGEWFILQYLAGKYSRVTSTDFVAFSFFMFTATICYAFSALYHTLMSHSYTVDHFCHRLDMLGIGIFIVGDIVLGCETTLRNIYWSMIRIFGTLTIIMNVHPKLQSHKYCSMRTLAFVVTGMSVVAPLIHGLDIFGLDLMNKKAFTYTMVAKIGCLLSGTALYAMVAWKIRHVQLPLIHAYAGVTTFCGASNHRDERQPSNLVSAVGDSGSKLFLGARIYALSATGALLASPPFGSNILPLVFNLKLLSYHATSST